jgi:hypothetical protein
MSQAGNALLRGVDAQAVVADLDRLRAAHVVAEQWLLAVENRLEGPALYLLEDELPAQAETNRQAGAALADRVAEVRGLIGAYAEALDRTRGADELTHRLLLELVRRQVATEAELEGLNAQE